MRKIKVCASILFSFFGFRVQASDFQIDLKTPRGALIKLDIYNKGAGSALILGPGQGCNSRLDLYDAIGVEARNRGFSLIRLYWAYCIANPKDGQPSEDLSTEKEDFLTAITYVQNILKFNKANIFIGGKSLGTFVSYELFISDKDFPGLVLLTPVCTDSQTDPSNHKNIFVDYYPQLGSEKRLVLLAQGNSDPLCDTSHFQEYLKDKGNNFIPLIIKGNHSLSIVDEKWQVIPDLSSKNLQVISKWIFSWL